MSQCPLSSLLFTSVLSALASLFTSPGYAQQVGQTVKENGTLIERPQETSKKIIRLYPIVTHGKAGFIDATGKVVIEPTFDHCGDFFDGLAMVQRGKKSGFIDATGSLIVEPVFDGVLDFSDGMGPVNRGSTGSVFGIPTGGKWGFVDSRGTIVIDIQFDSIPLGFSDGLCKIMVGAKHGYIDKSGMFVIPPQFRICGSFSDGLAYAKIGDKWGYIDKKGNTEIQAVFDGARDFSRGLAPVNFGGQQDPLRGTVGGKWGYIDRTGKIRIEPQFFDAYSFSEGAARIGAIVMSTITGRLEARVYYGFIDNQGKELTPVSVRPGRSEPVFENARDFKEGLAAVNKDGKWGYVDKRGELVIKPKYDNCEDFTGGVARVKLSDALLYIDQSGSILWRSDQPGN